MTIKLSNKQVVLVLSVFLITFLSFVTQLRAEGFFGSHIKFVTPTTNLVKPILHIAKFPDTDLTPQERQKLQGVRQSRIKEIMKSLDPIQRKQLEHELRMKKDIDLALAVVELNPDQRDFVNAVIELTNLKMKSIFSQHALLENK